MAMHVLALGLEVLALILLLKRVSIHRTDRPNPRLFEWLPENLRIVLPTSYSQAGRKLLGWLWLTYLLILATFVHLLRVIPHAQN